MSIALTEKQLEAYTNAKTFALEKIAPFGALWEEGGERTSAEAFKVIADAGYMGLLCPKDLGGRGLGFLESALIYSGLAHGDAGLAIYTQLINTITYTLAVNPNLGRGVKALMGDLISGRKTLSFAFTEKGAGTDPFLAKSTVALKEDGYHVNGEKTWASNSGCADYFIVFAKDERPRGMTAVLADKNTPGLSITENRKRLSGNVMTSGTVEFKDAVTPADMLVDKEGYALAMHTIDVARMFVAAVSVGAAERALDITCRFLAVRETFGKPVIKNQYVQFKLAELSNKVEAARWFLYRSASRVDDGESLSMPAAEVKLFCPEVAWEVTTECCQLFGGIGTETESEIVRLMGVAKAARVMDGTSEVQKMVLAKALEKKTFAALK